MSNGSATATHLTATEAATAAKRASRPLATASLEARNKALTFIAAGLRERVPEILAANAADLESERAVGLSDALRDRLTLTGDRVEGMAQGVEAVIALDDPIGEELDHRTIASGLDLRKVRVPLGVVAVIYEARPNVTVDCAALCIKSGNAIVLRGSSYAVNSNEALAAVVRDGIEQAGLPGDAVQVLSGSREELAELATLDNLIDLIIPRGGEGLKAVLKEVATVPVMYAASGNCHVYVDSDADLEMAREIIVNAKTSRPGVCNAAETLLVHKDVAADFLADALPALADAGVELVGDEQARSLAPEGVSVGDATEDDWNNEFLALKLAVGVVDSVDDAIEHVNEHGSGHSEAIVTGSPDTTGQQFANALDSAAVYINASTRFTDGFEFGMGAEIGISTQKLHARGPIGLRELTTTKYILVGEGQIRR